MFPDRSGEIPFFRTEALAALKRREFDATRACFFKFVEALRQQNVNVGGCLEAELNAAQALYSRFVRGDPGAAARVLPVPVESGRPEASS
jgi:hypothetical protein